MLLQFFFEIIFNSAFDTQSVYCQWWQ